MRCLSLGVALVLSLFAIAPADLGAQATDVIRGRVVGPDSQPLLGVRVVVTSLSGAVNREARTDRNGRFTATFPNGEGDYFVSYTLLGYAPRRFEIKRAADEDILVADARMSKVAELEGVRITAPRDRVNRVEANADISGTEKTTNTAAVNAADLGNLAAMAASLPGVTLIPGADGDPSGFSVLGLSADQNSTTLNGQQSSATDLPRDAALTSSLNTGTYDVSRGGFSGGQFNVRTRSGSNFKIRTMSFNLDDPKLQWTDAAGRSLGQRYSNYSLGGLASGPISLDKAFYSTSFQLGRRMNPLATLLNTDALGLETIGIAADSVKRLLNVLGTKGIPTTTGAPSSDRVTNSASVLGTFDWTPPTSFSGTAYNLTLNGSWNQLSPVSNLQTEMPAHSGERTTWSGGVQGRHSSYINNLILSETSVGFNESRNYGTPYLLEPNGSVRIASTFPDNTSGVKTVSFGGSPNLNASSTTTSTGLTNQLSWFSENNKHRIKLNTELRRDTYDQDQTFNQLGTFTYNSLTDLANGTPSSFSRTLSPRIRQGDQIVGALALGDSYRRSSDLQIQYGVRLDGNELSATPTLNPAIQSTFGVKNTYVPNRIYVSPRIGFAWTYGSSAQIGGFEGAFRGPRAVLRGGIGMFQNTPQTALMANAVANTGLPGAVQQVTCAGAAVPSPDWAGYLSNPSSIPSSCANGAGSTGFGSSAPNVNLFSSDYAAQRSLRSNVNWSGPILNNRFNATFDVTYSLNMNQPGTVDLNFNSTPRFALASEGGRPVYAPLTSIDALSGAIAAGAGRVSSAFNRVSQSRSDLHSESRQFSARFSPVSFSTAATWSLSYVYNDVREQIRGFTSTTGNPLDVEWARSAQASRHQVVYSVGYNFFDAVRVTWNGNVRSGTLFTPTISGDVNGDGYSNDRAFVPNPATTSDPALASSMQTLLNSASANVRDCLTKQLGSLAKRNACTGPVTHTANMSIAFNPLKLGLPQRATLSFAISNPLGAADLLLHGENRLQGWGSTTQPDQALLYVRGFNPVTQTYRYEVNQRFGNTSPQFNTIRTPVIVTAQFRFDLGPTREKQSLVQQMNAGRRSGGTKVTEAQLRAVYNSSGGLVNPINTMLRQADSLKLTQVQADSLATLNRWYIIQLDSTWAPVAKYLAAVPKDFEDDAVYEQYIRARRHTVDVLKKMAPGLKNLLTAEQYRMLPAIVASYLDTRYLDGIRNGTAGGAANPFASGGGAGIPGGGGGGGGGGRP
jgi:hypothetical protein